MKAKIGLKNICITAPVGISEKERKEKCTLQVSLFVVRDIREAAQKDDLRKSVDYTVLYEIVNAALSEPANLLETLILRIKEAVYKRYSDIDQVTIRIDKLQPAGLSNSESSFVEWNSSDA